ncbi:MAG: hypothetical protein LBC83_06895 [Oscillospiraceae bacterium]|jgi:hypothetical protein|nr:hypothetical protein [Oscillospiraceae bacterium]
MKKHNAQPKQTYQARVIFTLHRPKPKPARKTLNLGFVRFAYTKMPTVFDRYGKVTHESHLIEITTRRNQAVLHLWP